MPDLSDKMAELVNRRRAAEQHIVEYCRALVDVLEDCGKRNTAIRLASFYAEIDATADEAKQLCATDPDSFIAALQRKMGGL